MTSSASPLTGVVSVSTGSRHACALTSAGSVYCWGFNASGQLGDGTTTDRAQAVQVPGFSSVAQVALGGSFTCAIKTDGTLWCWGYNGNGQLGDGTTTQRTTPVQAGASTLGSNVAQVALGLAHACAIKTDGTLWCWGANSQGRLGDVATAPWEGKAIGHNIDPMAGRPRWLALRPTSAAVGPTSRALGPTKRNLRPSPFTIRELFGAPTSRSGLQMPSPSTPRAA